MSDPTVTDTQWLAGLPVVTNPWLPEGALFCHPNTLKTHDPEWIMARIADLERLLRAGGSMPEDSQP